MGSVVAEELHQLETEMLYNAFTRYQKELTNWVQSYHHIYPDVNEEMTETLSSMLLVWLIFQRPVDEDTETTIFDTFLENKVKKLKRPKTIDIIESWKGTQPAVLEVTNIEAQVYTSTNLLTGNEVIHSLPVDHEQTVEQGSIIIGFPATAETNMSFIGPVISHPVAKAADLKERVSTFQTKSADYSAKWPQLLSSLLSQKDSAVNLAEFDWVDLAQKETAERLLQGLEQDQQPPEIQMLALQKWHLYATAVKPLIRKSEVFAAAMEYVLQQFAPTATTQKQLAEKYNVSTSTISSRSKEIMEALKTL